MMPGKKFMPSIYILANGIEILYEMLLKLLRYDHFIGNIYICNNNIQPHLRMLYSGECTSVYAKVQVLSFLCTMSGVRTAKLVLTLAW